MSSSSKRICFITPNLQVGGMERVISVISNYAIEENFLIYIICLINDDIGYEINKKVKIITPDFKYKQGIYNKKRVAQYLYNTLKKIQPDSILSFSEAFNPLSIVVAKTARFPIFISDRSSPEVRLKPTTQLLRKLTYPLANGLILQTEFAKKSAEKKGYNSNISVIPNPLKVIAEHTDTVRKNVIISVGRLVSSKNFSELIDIFDTLKIKDSWELWILGDGPDRGCLEDKVKKKNLTGSVKLLGSVKDIDKYLSQASIFAFTSLSEGFPNALSEAIASPLPCIAYDCISGPSELIDHGINGFLIPLNDKTSFSHHLSKLIENPKLRLEMTRDYKHHRNKYKVDNIAKSYLSFILDNPNNKKL